MNRHRERAFTRTELIVVASLIAILGVLILLPQLARPKVHINRPKCASNLKNIGLAFRIYATDNNDRFPGWRLWSNTVNFSSIQVTDIYNALSNELSTPKILYCPQDTKRKEVNSFINLTPKNISYFASLTADETEPWHLLAGDRNFLVNGTPATGVLPLTINSSVSWSKDLHNEQGHIVMGDGSLQQMSSSQLKQAIRNEGASTNYLVFP